MTKTGQFLQYRNKPSSSNPPYVPIAFGGLWKDENISDDDIREIRREMFQSMDEKIL